MPSERIMTSLAPERIGQVCLIGGSLARTLGPFHRSEYPRQD